MKPLHSDSISFSQWISSIINDDYTIFKAGLSRHHRWIFETDEHGQSPLILAVKNRRLLMTQDLLDLGSDLYFLDSFGLNAFMHATLTNRQDLVQLFIQKNININFMNDGWTALMWASASNCSSMVHFLIQAGADPCVQNLDGLTALDIARQHKANLVVDFLQSYNECQALSVTVSGSSNSSPSFRL